MNPRLMRVAFVVIGILVVSIASYFLNDLNTRINTERSSMDNLREQASGLSATIADVRAGQFAYVVRGQKEEFWMSQVARLMPVAEKQAADFGASLSSPAAQDAFDASKAALENLKALDSRAREFVQGGTTLLAGDMIFSDGLEQITTASTQLMTALNEELRARHGATAGLVNRQTVIAGFAAGTMIVLLIALVVTSTAPAPAPEPDVAIAAAVDPVRFETPLPRAKPAVTPKLITTAHLCGELARISDSSQLPTLLMRASKVLDASGIIVWVAEPARNCLRPAISHGYEDKVVSRMGNIHRDANNAAAAAYRSAEIRTVAGDAITNGALVVPLMTSDGCVGVLSAEMKGGGEKDECSQALATIFAAQLATLLSTASNAGVSAAFTVHSEPPLKAAAQG